MGSNMCPDLLKNIMAYSKIIIIKALASLKIISALDPRNSKDSKRIL